jgi:hypothetical protein
MGTSKLIRRDDRPKATERMNAEAGQPSLTSFLIDFQPLEMNLRSVEVGRRRGRRPHGGPASDRSRQVVEKKKHQAKTRVLVEIDEGQQVTTQGDRSSSTVFETMRTLWPGATAGRPNATEERRGQLAPHTYRLCIVAGFQPSKLGPLLADALPPTPQPKEPPQAMSPALV